MLGKYILDKDGNPKRVKDLLRWARWFETADRQLKLDFLDNPFPPTEDDISYLAHSARGAGLEEAITKGDWRIKVSTVFLALDHNWFGGPPLIWETMVFYGPLHEYQRRWATKEEALAGHQEALMNAQSAIAVGKIHYR